MSIECFIKWAKSTRRKDGDSQGYGLEDEGPRSADEHNTDRADETGGKGKKGKAGSFVIEDFDAKELFNREWEVPIYGPIRRTGDRNPTDKTD